MRIFPILTALVVIASLYLVVFERDALLAFADNERTQAEPAAAEAPRGDAVSVVALKSMASEIDSAVVLRGRTEAARQVDVQAETTGQIVSDPLRKGSVVERGDLLCQLDPGTRQADLERAQAELAEAEINERAAARLSQDGFASEAQLAGRRAEIETARAAVAAARKELERLEIRAPFAGLLESDTAELGALLQPGALCATVIQLDPVKLIGFVPEIDVDRIAVGAPATARLATGDEVTGRVTFLSRSADPETRTFQVEVQVGNDDLRIRDGQTAEIIIQSDGLEAHLLPQSALTLNDEGELGVRIVDEDDTARFVAVDLLRDTPRGVWLAGLPPQVDVIVVGQEYGVDGVPVAPTYRNPTQ